MSKTNEEYFFLLYNVLFCIIINSSRIFQVIENRIYEIKSIGTEIISYDHIHEHLSVIIVVFRF